MSGALSGVLAMLVLLLGRRAWSWRTHDEPVPYGFLPFQRKDRTIKPWDQTPRALGHLLDKKNVLPSGSIK